MLDLRLISALAQLSLAWLALRFQCRGSLIFASKMGVKKFVFFLSDKLVICERIKYSGGLIQAEDPSGEVHVRRHPCGKLTNRGVNKTRRKFLQASLIVRGSSPSPDIVIRHTFEGRGYRFSRSAHSTTITARSSLSNSSRSTAFAAAAPASNR